MLVRPWWADFASSWPSCPWEASSHTAWPFGPLLHLCFPIWMWHLNAGTAFPDQLSLKYLNSLEPNLDTGTWGLTNAAEASICFFVVDCIKTNYLSIWCSLVFRVILTDACNNTAQSIATHILFPPTNSSWCKRLPVAQGKATKLVLVRNLQKNTRKIYWSVTWSQQWSINPLLLDLVSTPSAWLIVGCIWWLGSPQLLKSWRRDRLINRAQGCYGRGVAPSG